MTYNVFGGTLNLALSILTLVLIVNSCVLFQLMSLFKVKSDLVYWVYRVILLT